MSQHKDASLTTDEQRLDPGGSGSASAETVIRTHDDLDRLLRRLGAEATDEAQRNSRDFQIYPVEIAVTLDVEIAEVDR